MEILGNYNTKTNQLGLAPKQLNLVMAKVEEKIKTKNLWNFGKSPLIWNIGNKDYFQRVPVPFKNVI